MEYGDKKIIEEMDKTDNVNKAYNEIREKERKKNIREKAKELPKDIFQVIYCDPPWEYSNNNLRGSAEDHYSTMNIKEMANKFNIQSISDNNSIIFMWTTNPLLKDALWLMDAWGFAYKTNIVWIKGKATYGKLGFYIYGQHELLLIGTCGSMLPTGEKPKSIIYGENKKHSKKPEIYDLIEKMYPDLKYIELFARNKRKNWSSWGNEIE